MYVGPQACQSCWPSTRCPFCPCPPADKFVAAASLLLRQNVWQQLLLRNPHNQLLRMYTEKKRARNYRGLWDRIDTELYLTGALIFDWCAALLLLMMMWMPVE